MKLGLNLRLSQSIKLTPRLQQSIKLLHASQAELNDLIEEYLSDNVFLSTKDKVLLNKKSSQSQHSSDTNYYEIFDSEAKNQSLKEYLVENIAIFNFSAEDQLIISYLIDSIGENGYLIDSLEGIRSSLPLENKPNIQQIEKLLKLIQNSTHPGIGSRNLTECLIIQLELIENKDQIYKLAKVLVKNYLNMLANKNYEELKKNLKCTDMNLEKAITLIKNLNPKPGLIYQKLTKTSFIAADAIIKKENGGWVTSLSEENNIKLKLIENAQILANTSPDQDLKEKLQEAKWLIKNLNERSISILRVARAIMKNQMIFLENGESSIRSLTLKKIALDLDLHESTISRISTNKFISTPHGIYELKFFFNSSFVKDNGNVSSRSLLNKINFLVSNENPQTPYSDSEICKMLNDDGIEIARRTVAKYRIKLKILPSNQRKV
ncbi:RNA polymerase factor sigma-54 [Methylophilaceae bacterium]|nr:RNA polymerase factor sigma-54 [Methylophilaceae bacterium]